MATNHKNAYPHFVPNQLLKSSTLNGYFAFLDEQTRLSRVHFLGCGIVEGLDFSVAGGTLVIEPGVAVNRDGWLVQVPDQTEYKYAVEVPATAQAFNSDNLKELLEQGGSHISWICFPTEEDAMQFDSDEKKIVVTPLSELELKDFIIALAFGKRPEFEGRCSQDHCNLNTADEILEAWPVLIPKRDISSLFQKITPLNWAVLSQKEPALEYFHGDVEEFNRLVRSSAISWKAEVYDAMTRIEKTPLSGLDQTALDHVFTDSGALKVKFNEAKSRIQGLVDADSKDVPDYMISFFGDMAAALNEFIEEYNVFAGKYGLVPNVIPADLLVYLGPVDEDNQKDLDVYRSVFRSAMKEEFRKDSQRLTRMLQRICLLSESFIAKPSDVRIAQKAVQLEKVRPGGCLSSRPAPFYYDTSVEGFYEAWNADKAYVNGAFDFNSEKVVSSRYLDKSGSMNAEGWSLYLRAYQGKSPSAVKNELEALNRELRLSIDVVEVGLNQVDKLSVSDADILEKLLKSIKAKPSFFEDVKKECTGNVEAFSLTGILGSAFDTRLVQTLCNGGPLSDKSYQEITQVGDVDDATWSKIAKAAIKVSGEKKITEKELTSAFKKLILAWKNSFMSVAEGVKLEEIGRAVSLAPIKRGCRVFLFTGPISDNEENKTGKTVLSYGVVYRDQADVSHKEDTTLGFKMRTKVQVNGEYADDVSGSVNPFAESERWEISKDNELVLYPYIFEGSSAKKFETDKSNIECTSSNKDVLIIKQIKFLEEQAVPVVILEMVGNGTTWVNLTIKDPRFEPYQKGFSVNVDNPVWNIIDVTRVLVSHTYVELFMNSTLQLSATVEPADATDPSIGWDSKDHTIARVSSSGLLRPMKEGKTEICAFAKSDKEKKATVTLQVSSFLFRMKAVRKDGTSFYADIPEGFFNPFEPLKDGSVWDFYNDEFRICPYKNDGSSINAYLTDKSTSLTGEVSGEQIMTSKTVVHPDFNTGSYILLNVTKNGKSKLTLRIIKDNEVIVSRTIVFDVHNPEWDKVPVKGLSLPTKSLELYVGQTERLVAEVIPFNASTQDVEWTSSIKSIASVVQNTGDVTAFHYGSTVITARTVEGSFKQTMKVYVSSLLLRGELKEPVRGDMYADMPDVIERGQWSGRTYMKIYPFKKVERTLVNKGASDLVPLALDTANLIVLDGSNVGTQVVTEDGKVPHVRVHWPKAGVYELTIQIKDPKDPDNILHSQTFTVKV